MPSAWLLCLLQPPSSGSKTKTAASFFITCAPCQFPGFHRPERSVCCLERCTANLLLCPTPLWASLSRRLYLQGSFIRPITIEKVRASSVKIKTMHGVSPHFPALFQHSRAVTHN